MAIELHPLRAALDEQKVSTNPSVLEVHGCGEHSIDLVKRAFMAEEHGAALEWMRGGPKRSSTRMACSILARSCRTLREMDDSRERNLQQDHIVE